MARLKQCLQSILFLKKNEDSKDDILQAFIDTGIELLESTEDTLMTLIKFGDNLDIQEYLNTVMRNFHTIKGNAGFLGLGLIETVSHCAESVIEEMIEKRLPFEEGIVDLVMSVVDLLRDAIAKINRKEPLQAPPFTELTSKLRQILEIDEVFPEDKAGAIPVINLPPMSQQETNSKSSPSPTSVEKEKESIPKLTASQAVEKPTQKPKQAQAANKQQEAAQDIRVSLPKLDMLIDLVGELVIAEAMVSHHPSLNRPELDDLRNAARHLNRNIRELQELAMSLRMVPVSATFRRMIRVVRDIAKKLGKQVELEILGETTEVDKTLVERIADPMLHLIRNAMDHGLEGPEERKDMGKSPTGHITLEASHVGSEVWIQIIDDGRGLNREKILKKGIEKGIITEEQGESMPDADVWKLIMEAGFSTADQVTDVSGRGVGMDVVKRNIENLRGSIDVTSHTDNGSIFTLRIPLTLTIIDGLLVNVGNTFYALPTVAIQETLRPVPKNITRTMDGTEMLRIRKQLLPVVRLHLVYNIQPMTEYLTKGMLLIVEQAGERFALFVDSVVGQQQIVVKALPESMNVVPHLSGCTILGDGQVGLIVDIGNLAKDISAKAHQAKNQELTLQ